MNKSKTWRHGAAYVVAMVAAVFGMSAWSFHALASSLPCRDRVCERPVSDEHGDPEDEREMPAVDVAPETRDTPLEKAAAAYIVKMPRALYGGAKGKPKPETTAEEDVRRQLIAWATRDAAVEHVGFDPVEATALVLTTMYGESGFFDWYVHAGRDSHLGTQDKRKATCLAQIHTWPGNALLPEGEWERLAGTDYAATLRCARASLAYFWHHAKRCRVRAPDPTFVAAWRDTPKMFEHEVAALMAAYGSGTCVQPSELPKAARDVIKQRVSTWSRMVKEFRAAQAELP